MRVQVKQSGHPIINSKGHTTWNDAGKFGKVISGPHKYVFGEKMENDNYFVLIDGLAMPYFIDKTYLIKVEEAQKTKPLN